MTYARKNGTGPRRVDVHTHMIPREYVELLATIGITGTPGRDFPKWSAKKHLRMMDRCGIETSILSLSTPGCYFIDDAFSRKLARVINDSAAELVREHPGRFGAFASLPLPDVEGALLELDHALDELCLDGVVLLTNVNGVYLGDPRYEELFAELDRREAVVFIHPNDYLELEPRYAALTPLLERPLETTRAVTSLLASGTLARYPRIRYILAHGGGSVPFLAERIAAAASGPTASPFDRSLDAPADIDRGLELLGGLFYDTAQPGEAHLATVQELTDHGHILFGSDAGWATPVETSLTTKAVADYDGFDAAGHREVCRDNALALFPRLARKEVAS